MILEHSQKLIYQKKVIQSDNTEYREKVKVNKILEKNGVNKIKF